MKKLSILLLTVVVAATGIVWAEITPTIEVMPLYASAAHSQQTPFAVFLRATGLTEGTAYEFTAKLRQNDSDYGSFTTAEVGDFNTSYKSLGTSGAEGILAKWIFLRPSKSSPAPGPCQIRIRIREVGKTTSTPVDFAGLTLLDMSDAGDGAWVTGGEGTNPPDGYLILAYDGEGGLLGAYAVEDNGLNEGDDPDSGHWQIALPANTNIARFETRDANNSVYATDSDPGWESGAPGTTTVLSDISLYLTACPLTRWGEIKALFK